ncbi:sigma-70 family RNA polymerase sigma factor [Streptomyces sp. NPDC058377]|uniref:sigma-70 family RNA polymerase sigma factor n=1 Tax=Streptomyces sp. NPDC058377 TaxID=3346468 RepID=UPI00365CDD75
MTAMSMRTTGAHGVTTQWDVMSVTRTAVGTGAGGPDLPWIEDAGKVAPRDARAMSKLFFDRFQTLEEGPHEHQYARSTLIETNLSLVRFVAQRFRSRGGDGTEEIVQVGTTGLIEAIDRFDLSREVQFATFAIPYITGEIKRFFRDTTWSVHVPRRLQELRVELAKAKETLSSKLDRDPTVKELAAPLLEQLDDRERLIIQMRCGAEMTQAQIGAELGISQMQISRLLNRIVRKLRAGMSIDT